MKHLGNGPETSGWEGSAACTMCDDAGLDFMNARPENIAMPAGAKTLGQVESWYGVCVSFN